MQKIKVYLIVAAIFLIAIVASLLLVIDTGDFRILKDLESGGWTIHAWAGLVLFIFIVLIILVSQLKKRFPVAHKALARITPGFKAPDSTRIKWWTMVILGALAVYAFTYCNYICKSGGVPLFDCNINFFHMLFRFSLSLFPYLILGCLFGGLIMKYFAAGRFKLPAGMFSAGIFAALIPVCSCGAVPLVRGMLAGGQIRVRTVITFLMIAPVLSVIIIPLCFELGVAYAIARIVSIFVLATVTGILVEHFAGVKAEGDTRAGCYACKGCAGSSQKLNASNGVLLAGWDIMIFLLPYISMGVIIGALIAKYVPASVVGDYLSGDFWGLVISSSIGLPVNLCSGQEIIILTPLVNKALMGTSAVPLGNAIAFSLAGPGICLSALPALLPTIGKRATIMVVASFWIGSIMLGWAINSLGGFLHFG